MVDFQQVYYESTEGARDARESKPRSPETSDANGGALRKIYIDGCYIQLKFRLDIALYYFHEFFKWPPR